MKVLQSNIPTNQRSTQEYWIKVYTKNPYSIQFLGPFSSPNEAQRAQDRYRQRLESQGQNIVSYFHLLTLSHPVSPDSPMSHSQWLQSLMEDYLHVTIPYTRSSSAESIPC